VKPKGWVDCEKENLLKQISVKTSKNLFPFRRKNFAALPLKIYKIFAGFCRRPSGGFSQPWAGLAVRREASRSQRQGGSAK